MDIHIIKESQLYLGRKKKLCMPQKRIFFHSDGNSKISSQNQQKSSNNLRFKK